MASQESTTYELSTNDGSVMITATHEPGYIERLRVREELPAALDRGGVAILMHQAGVTVNGEPVDVNELRAWTNFVSPYDPTEGIVHAKAYRSFGRLLGYQREEHTDVAAKRRVTEKVLRYPSVERANHVMSLFPRAPFRFARHQGGDYGAEEFLEGFVQPERGTVLVANEQPYQIHDLSDHLAGWMAFDPALAENFRMFGRAYIRRIAAERELPRVPVRNDDPHEKERAEAFLFPSLSVIRLAVRNLDLLTGEITRRLFDGLGQEPRGAHLLGSIIDHYSSVRLDDAAVGPRVPFDAFTGLPNSTAAAERIIERFEAADRISQTLTLSDAAAA